MEQKTESVSDLLIKVFTRHCNCSSKVKIKFHFISLKKADQISARLISKALINSDSKFSENFYQKRDHRTHHKTVSIGKLSWYGIISCSWKWNNVLWTASSNFFLKISADATHFLRKFHYNENCQKKLYTFNKSEKKKQKQKTMKNKIWKKVERGSLLSNENCVGVSLHTVYIIL